MISVVTRSSAETQAWGERLGQLVQPGDVVLLHGDLGAGKTTLTQGLAQGLGIAGPVQSPTFTLVNEYEAPGTPLVHLDLYRLDGPDDLDSIGYDDLVSLPDAVVVVEWPERAGVHLPDSYLLVQIQQTGPDERTLTISAMPDNGPQARIVAELATSRAEERP